MKNVLVTIVIILFQCPILADWVFQSSGVTNPLFGVHFIDQINGYVVGSDGLILHTSDGGENWNVQTSGITFWLRSVFFTNLNSGWVVGSAGIILHTTNGGDQWFDQTSGTNMGLNDVFFIDSLHGWIAGDNGVILHTNNGGNSWFIQTSGIPNVTTSVLFVSLMEGWISGVGGKILHTTNGGAQWSNQTSGTTQSLTSVFFTDSNNGWSTGSNGIILHTTNNGNEWFEQTSGITQSLSEIHFTSSVNGWAVGGSGTILHTTNGGNNWLLDFDAGWNNLSSVFFADSLNGWAVGNQGMICKYTTEEIIINWCNLQEPPIHTMSIYDSVEVFARVFVDSITILPGPCYDILAWIGYNTENTNPNTWSNWVPAEFNSDVGANDEYSCYLSELNTGTYYYASRFQIFGGEYYYGGYPNGFWDGINNISGILYIFPFQVIEWCNLADPPTHSMIVDDSVEIFAQVFVDGVTNIAGQGEGILSWIGLNSENSDPSTWSNWIPADYKQDIGGNDEYSQFLTSPDTGIYYYASRFQIDEGSFYYGGYPNGFWNGITNISGVLTVTPIVNLDENNLPILNYALDQNYPNPFNPSTTISFEIPEIGFVTLKIYDVLGNEIATIVNEEKQAGKYEIKFFLDQNYSPDITSGIYFYQLKTRSFIQTKKMILIK
jgi:photosystem II stability/assembly factor-like uncharacterized protein